MENNFNGEMNNGFEAVNDFGNHKSFTNGQVAAMVLIGSIIVAAGIKGIDLLKKRRKEARNVLELFNMFIANALKMIMEK